MFKVGDKVKYTGNTPVFPKDGVHEVEASNRYFFIVQGLCFNQEGKHWTLEQSIKVGDWVVSPSDKGVHQYESWMKNTICTKISIDNHPHKEVMLAYAEGKKIQYYTEAVAAWSDCNSPSFYLADKYRVKPDLEAGDWVTDKVGCLFKATKGMSGFGYYKATNHRHWDVAQAWDKGAIVQLKTLKDKWKDVVTPIFDPYTEYRIKPSFKVGDWCVHGDSHRLITNITLGDVKFKGEVWSHALEDCEPMAPGHKHWETMQAWANGAEVESTRHGDVWLGVVSPLWCNDQYRVKQSLGVGDWVYHLGDPKYVSKMIDNRCCFKGYMCSASQSTCTKITDHPHMTLMNKWVNGAEIEVYLQGWEVTSSPSWCKQYSYRLAEIETAKKYQVFHNSKAYGIKVTFVDNKITAISAD